MNNSGDYDECTILYTSVSSTMPVFSSITEPSVNNFCNYIECTVILYTTVSSTIPVFSSITEPSVNNFCNYDNFSVILCTSSSSSSFKFTLNNESFWSLQILVPKNLWSKENVCLKHFSRRPGLDSWQTPPTFLTFLMVLANPCNPATRKLKLKDSQMNEGLSPSCLSMYNS